MGLRTSMTEVGNNRYEQTTAGAVDVGGYTGRERNNGVINMLKIATLTAAALAMSISGASADGYAAAPSSFKWAGLYVGSTLGYGFGSSRTFFNNCDNRNTCGQYPDDAHPDYVNNDPSGAMLGLTVGYNWEAGNRWVYGVEADISMADIKGKDNVYWADGHHWHTGWNGLTTLRARAGWEYDPKTLLYVTGGAAVVNSQEYNIGDQVAEDNDQSSDNSGYRWGWVVGAGVERAFSDRWTGKIEYMHVGMADNCGHAAKNNGASTYCYYNDLDVIRVGVNYKVN
jgi:outer membrane immunogenic protein